MRETYAHHCKCGRQTHGKDFLACQKIILSFSISFLPKNACKKNPCKNNATCQAGFTDKTISVCVLMDLDLKAMIVMRVRNRILSSVELIT